MKDALQKALTMKLKIDHKQRELAREKPCRRHQKFLAQETQIETKRELTKKLRDDADDQLKAYENYLVSLNVE